jgi:hypothetical protein
VLPELLVPSVYTLTLPKARIVKGNAPRKIATLVQQIEQDHLELVDPKTGESLYADSRIRVGLVLKELRKRVEERGKPSKDK